MLLIKQTAYQETDSQLTQRLIIMNIKQHMTKDKVVVYRYTYHPLKYAD